MFRFVKYNSNLSTSEIIEKIEEETTEDTDLINIEPLRGIHAVVTEKNYMSMYFHSGNTDFTAGRTCPFFYGKISESNGKTKISGVITVSFYIHIIVLVALAVFLVSELFALQSGSFIPLIIFGIIFISYMTVAVVSWTKSSYDIEEIDNYLQTFEST